MKLTDYMKKAEAVYKEYGAKYVEELQEDAKILASINSVRTSRDFTEEGKASRIANLRRESEKHKANMAALAAAANTKAAEIRKEVAQGFYGHFHAMPAAIDPNGMELLRSGILTDAELVNLTNSYEGNNTMERICATYLEKREDKALQQMASVIKSKGHNDVHLRCIDSIIDVGRRCVGDTNAPVFLRKFDEITAQTYAAAPDISD